MKNMLLLNGLILFSVSCNQAEEKQRQKKYLDTLLDGEPISIKELERDTVDSDPEAFHGRILPYETARKLGYSNEDIQKLKNAKVVLEQPEKE